MCFPGRACRRSLLGRGMWVSTMRTPALIVRRLLGILGELPSTSCFAILEEQVHNNGDLFGHLRTLSVDKELNSYPAHFRELRSRCSMIRSSGLLHVSLWLPLEGLEHFSRLGILRECRGLWTRLPLIIKIYDALPRVNVTPF